jgi:hypothetical protein
LHDLCAERPATGGAGVRHFLRAKHDEGHTVAPELGSMRAVPPRSVRGGNPAVRLRTVAVFPNFALRSAFLRWAG